MTLRGFGIFSNEPLWPWAQSWKHTSVCLLTLVKNSSDVWETWPRDVGTTKREDCVTRSRKHSKNVFGSKAMSVEGAVVTVYLFIVLKIGTEHDLHQIMPPIDSLQRYDVCHCWFAGLPGARTNCGQWHHIPHLPHIHKHPASLILDSLPQSWVALQQYLI